MVRVITVSYPSFITLFASLGGVKGITPIVYTNYDKANIGIGSIIVALFSNGMSLEFGSGAASLPGTVLTDFPAAILVDTVVVS